MEELPPQPVLLRAKGKKTHVPEGASYIFCKRKHCHFLWVVAIHRWVSVEAIAVCSLRIKDFRLRTSAGTGIL